MPSSVNKAEALKRIDSVIKYVRDEVVSLKKLKPSDSSAPFTINKGDAAQLSVRLKQTILDMAPRGSAYWDYASSFSDTFVGTSVPQLYGALLSLREDYANDFLNSFNETLDAEIFTDILEQAEHLLSLNHFRASAVVAGVALESHLRKLAEKNSIPITTNEGKYIKADSLNGELRKKEIIDSTLNKSITSWLGLRNDAAHPDKKEINEGLLEPMIAGIRVFIEKYPA